VPVWQKRKGHTHIFPAVTGKPGPILQKEGTRPDPGNNWRKKLPFAGFGMGICWQRRLPAAPVFWLAPQQA